MNSFWNAILKRIGSLFLVCGVVWIVVLICIWFYQYDGASPRISSSLQVHIPASSAFKDLHLDLGTVVAEVTVVTASFSLKHLKNKQPHGINYKMLDELSTLNNSIVLFTDDNDIKMYFADLRRHSKTPIYTTDIIVLMTKSLYFDQTKLNHPEGNPYIPQTVEEFYTYFKHWKYELLEWVIADKMIQTKYVTWFDPIVYFDSTNNLQNLIEVPMGLKDNHIAFKQINDFSPDLNTRDVLQKNKVWVSGNLFFGKPIQIWILIMDYKKQLKELISEYGLISSDEQVLYTMHLNDSKIKPRVHFQTYI